MNNKKISILATELGSLIFFIILFLIIGLNFIFIIIIGSVIATSVAISYILIHEGEESMRDIKKKIDKNLEKNFWQYQNKINTERIFDEDIIDIDKEYEYEIYEELFLDSSSIIKIWLFNSEDNCKIYEETLDYSRLGIEENYINISEISIAEHPKELVIESSITVIDSTVYLYLYSSKNQIKLILLTTKKIKKLFLNIVKRSIESLTDLVDDFKINHKRVKNFLDEKIYLYNSRRYEQISAFRKEIINEIFKNQEDRDFIFQELPQTPIGTFSEFLSLFEQLELEEKISDTEEQFNNMNYFKEVGF